MKLTVRIVATALAVFFALYFAARGLWWTTAPRLPWLLVVVILVFVGVILTTVVVGVRERLKMPTWPTAVALASAVLLPIANNIALDPASLRAPYATWYIGGIGLVGVVLIVRRRTIAGWLSLLALAITTIAWIGLGDALGLGLVGSIVWMVVAQLLVTFWDRAVDDTDRLASIQQAASAWQTTQAVRQRERRERVRYALAVAGPSLARLIEKKGDLSPDERLEARYAEGRLRDEIRGGSILNDQARAAIEDARRRGSTVAVFDDGGLEGLGDAAKERIRAELAAVLREAHAERIIIRSAKDSEVAVTVVGRSAAPDGSDEDSVELWHEIRRTEA